LVKAVTNSWVKKAIPYLQTGLNVAEVHIFLTWANVVGRCAGPVRASYHRCPFCCGCILCSPFHSNGLASQSHFRCIRKGDRCP
jgi:hypothetical protein